MEGAVDICIDSCMCGIGYTLGARLANSMYDGAVRLWRKSRGGGRRKQGAPGAHSPAAWGSGASDRHFPEHGERAARRRSAAGGGY